MAKTEQQDIASIVRFLKSNPAFHRLQEYISTSLDEARDAYEYNEASEFLRGRVSILKELKKKLES